MCTAYLSVTPSTAWRTAKDEEDPEVSNEARYQQGLSTLAVNWRALALRGVVALIFGLVVLFWPGLVVAVLALLFGLYAILDGAITFVPALRSPDRGAQKMLPLAEGAGVSSPDWWPSSGRD